MSHSYIPGQMSAQTIKELKRIRDSFLAEITCPPDISKKARAAHPISGGWQPFTHKVKREKPFWQCYHCKKRFVSAASCERHYRNKNVVKHDIPILMSQSKKGNSPSSWKKHLERLNTPTIKYKGDDE